MEGVFDVTDSHPIALHEHPDDIEAIMVIRASVAIDPDAGRPPQLPLFAEVDSLHGIPKSQPPARLHLHERHGTTLLHHEIDIPVAIPESALNQPPAPAPEPPLRHTLPQLSQYLRGR